MSNDVVKAPPEPKVTLGTIAGGSGAILSAFLLWVLGVTVFDIPFTADQADDAIAAVPWPITGLVGLVLTVGGYFFGGYMAPHAARPSDQPQPVVVNNVTSIPEVTGPAELHGLPVWNGEEPDSDAEEIPHAEHLLSPDEQAKRAVPEDGIPNDPEKV